MLQARLALSEACTGAAEAGARLNEALFMRARGARARLDAREALLMLSRNVCTAVCVRVLGLAVDPHSDLRRFGHV